MLPRPTKRRNSQTTTNFEVAGTKKARASRPKAASNISAIGVQESLTNGSRRSVVVNWSTPTNHYLTDLLLTKIEESATWRQVLGFSPIPGESAPANLSQGKKMTTHYQELADLVFHGSKESPDEWKSTDIKLLADSVKNRVFSLKRTYQGHRKDLGTTGHGLAVNGHEDEISSTINPSVANVWQKIQDTFPWYKRMHNLIGSSPAIDRSAVMHSTTSLDLGVLDLCSQDVKNNPEHNDTAHSGSELFHSPFIPDELENFTFDLGAPSSDITNSSPSSPLNIPFDYTLNQKHLFTTPSSLSINPATPSPMVKHEVATPTRVSKITAKRASATEQLVAALTSSRQTQLDITAARNQNRLDLEERRIAWEREKEDRAQAERDATRRHELAMIEQRIILERLTKGFPSTNFTS